MTVVNLDLAAWVTNVARMLDEQPADAEDVLARAGQGLAAEIVASLIERGAELVPLVEALRPSEPLPGGVPAEAVDRLIEALRDHLVGTRLTFGEGDR